MNKTQLIDALAAHYEGNRKAAAHALESVLDTITREVARGEKVAITGFGSFEKRIREARTVRNPQTGEQMKSKKKAVPAFKPGQDLKNIISGAKKLPALSVAVAGSAVRAATQGSGSGTAATSTEKATPTKKGAAATAEKATSKKATAKKATAKKATAKAAPAKAAPTKATAKAAAKKSSTAKKSTAKKSSTAKRSPAKKSSTARKSPAKRTAKKS